MIKSKKCVVKLAVKIFKYQCIVVAIYKKEGKYRIFKKSHNTLYDSILERQASQLFKCYIQLETEKIQKK